MKKNLFITVIVMAIAGLLISACQPAAGSGTTGETSPTQGESEATSAPAEDISNLEVLLDPALVPDSEAIPYIYESLVKNMEGEDQPVSVLAIDGTVSEDGLDYIFNLRSGVTFHDGTQLNADAVIANFNRWFDPQDPLRGSGDYQAWADNFGGFKGEVDADGLPKSNFDGIEKVDDLTILVHLNSPDPDFQYKLANTAFAIVSPAALSTPGFGTTAGVDGGTGPYVIGEFSSTSLTLEPNPDYWNPDAIPASSIEVTP
jgi:peptide/nickel transport system substrate-binding protein